MTRTDDFKQVEAATHDDLASLSSVKAISTAMSEHVFYTTAEDSQSLTDVFEGTPFRILGVGYPRVLSGGIAEDLERDPAEYEPSLVCVLATVDPRSDHYSSHSPFRTDDEEDSPPHDPPMDEQAYLERLRAEFDCLSSTIETSLRTTESGRPVLDVTSVHGTDDPVLYEGDPYTDDLISILFSLSARGYSRETGVDAELSTPDHVADGETLTITYDFDGRKDPVDPFVFAFDKLRTISDYVLETSSTDCPRCGGTATGEKVVQFLDDEMDFGVNGTTAEVETEWGETYSVTLHPCRETGDNADVDDEQSMWWSELELASGSPEELSDRTSFVGYECEECGVQYAAATGDDVRREFVLQYRGADETPFDQYRTDFADPFNEDVVDAFVENRL